MGKDMIMRDELYDREYQSIRSAANRDLGEKLARLGQTIRVSLEALHRVQFDAPWNRKSKRIGWG